MGYEITYLFHERKEDGSYDTTNKKELKKKVGTGFDDTPLEKVAASVLSQLSRRDIWVVDVKVFELVKKEINYKESKDGRGIVLKNKKFSFDGSAQLIADDVQEAEPEVAAAMKTVQTVSFDVKQPVPQLQAISVKQLLADKGGNLAPALVNQKRVLFKIVFEPDARHKVEIEREGYKLTPYKQYGVHRQFENPLGGQFGNIYTITDDAGKPVDIEEKYFTVAGAGLVGGEEFNRDFQRDKQPKLLYDGQSSSFNAPVKKYDRNNLPEEWRNIPVEGEESFDHTSMQMPNLRPNYKP